jgi:hypothetical protein
MPTNLWPDFDRVQTPRSPKAVVAQAGAGLSDKTMGLVTFFSGTASVKDGMVEVDCSLWVPALMYHYPFLRLRFGVDPMYPVTVIASGMSDTKAKDDSSCGSAFDGACEGMRGRAPSFVDCLRPALGPGLSPAGGRCLGWWL